MVKGPEPVADIIMFQAGMILHSIKTTMVVGQQKTRSGNYFGGTKSTKTYNGILKASFTDIVNI